MCLVVLSLGEHPDYPLILAANRDEFYARPTRDAGWWPDRPDVVGGRDLQAGGTWLGITRSRRFAALTNYRESARPAARARHSRGLLVNDWLAGDDEPMPAARGLADAGVDYSGFNLLLGRPGALVYLSNRGADPRPVTVGVHGLSNHLLDTDWPKVRAGRERLVAALADDAVDIERLFGLLGGTQAVDGALPDGLAARLADALDHRCRHRCWRAYRPGAPAYRPAP